MKLAALLRTLESDLAERIERGDYDGVAQVLEARGDHFHAAVLWETTWNFERASAAFLAGGNLVDALRCALESPNAALADDLVRALSTASTADRAGAERLLRQRGRSGLLAHLLAGADPRAHSEALADTGDILGAAKTLANAGKYDEALHRLRPLDDARAPLEHLALAASLHWKLGDAERAAKLAQRALRRGATASLNGQVLAPALVALGHGLAADIARLRGGTSADEASLSTPDRGRYVVQGVAPHPFAGRALLAVDRIEHREVEIHDLFAGDGDAHAENPEAMRVVQRFIETALAAAELRHPALRPILWGDVSAGMLILERGSSATLRALIRPPGLRQDQLRVKAMMRFMLTGLAAAHDRGLVHGALLPSLIVFDPAERPLLSPFGLHQLSGIVATRTGSLDELLTLTAPEVSAGAAPTAASDIFAVGHIMAALLRGKISETLTDLPEELAPLLMAMVSPSPAQRPTAREVIEQLTSPRDATHRLLSGRHLAASGAPVSPSSTPAPAPHTSLAHTATDAHPSWPDDVLEMLCEQSHGFLQPIIDRRGRQLVVAAWPEGCSPVSGIQASQEVRSRELFAAIERLPSPVTDAIRCRMSDGSVIQTPAGDWMLSLDDLLSRAPLTPRDAPPAAPT